MLITRIELQNVKSYHDDVISFTAGTNSICGENGAGKSTLLEAIGFALFDYLPYNQASFVREGEKTATVAVNFIQNGILMSKYSTKFERHNYGRSIGFKALIISNIKQICAYSRI